MVTHKDIKYFSKRYGINYEISKGILENFVLEYHFSVSKPLINEDNYKKFINKCIYSKNIKERFNKLTDLISQIFNKNHLKALIHIVKHHRILLSCWAFIDELDKALKNNKAVTKHPNELLYYHVLYSDVLVLLDKIGRKLYGQLSDLLHKSSIQDILTLVLVEELGFDVFKLKFIEKLVSTDYSEWVPNEYYSELSRRLYNHYHSNKTGRNPWLIYFLVEQLILYGYGIRESFRITSKILTNEIGNRLEKKTYKFGQHKNEYLTESIHSTYYRKQKEIKKKKLDKKEIVQKYRLSSEIQGLLKENGIYKKKLGDSIQENIEQARLMLFKQREEKRKLENLIRETINE